VHIKYLLATPPNMVHDPRLKTTALRIAYLITFMLYTC